MSRLGVRCCGADGDSTHGEAIVASAARSVPAGISRPRPSGRRRAAPVRHLGWRLTAREGAHAVTTPHITESPEWYELHAHHDDLATQHLRDLFAGDPERGTTMALTVGDVYFDYSKHRADSGTIAPAGRGRPPGGSAGAHRCDVCGRAHQRHGGPGGAPRCAAGAADDADHRGR